LTEAEHFIYAAPLLRQSALISVATLSVYRRIVRIIDLAIDFIAFVNGADGRPAAHNGQRHWATNTRPS